VSASGADLDIAVTGGLARPIMPVDRIGIWQPPPTAPGALPGNLDKLDLASDSLPNGSAWTSIWASFRAAATLVRSR
jgi:hypothetical protein